MQKLGVFWKIQNICYQMGTEIFKIEEEMTEKMKPEVANPPPKMGRIFIFYLKYPEFCHNTPIFCILDEFEGSYGCFSTKRHFFETPCTSTEQLTFYYCNISPTPSLICRNHHNPSSCVVCLAPALCRYHCPVFTVSPALVCPQCVQVWRQSPTETELLSTLRGVQAAPLASTQHIQHTDTFVAMSVAELSLNHFQ